MALLPGRERKSGPSVVFVGLLAFLHDAAVPIALFTRPEDMLRTRFGAPRLWFDEEDKVGNNSPLPFSAARKVVVEDRFGTLGGESDRLTGGTISVCGRLFTFVLNDVDLRLILRGGGADGGGVCSCCVDVG